MVLGGYSIVNFSWDCCLSAIFKPLSWHGAYTQQCVHAHTQSVTSAYSRDITAMLFFTHYMLISLTPSVVVFFLLTVFLIWSFLLSSALHPNLWDFFLTSSHPCSYTHTLWMFLILGGYDHIPFYPRSHVLQEQTHGQHRSMNQR